MADADPHSEKEREVKMGKAVLRTRLCELVGIDYPIVQTGMGWVASAGLTAATANAGGLGIIAGSTLDFGQLADAIARTKDRTARPFGVNLRSDAPDVFERADLMIREGVKVASFALAPSEKLIKKFKDAGLVCIPSIGARRHAEKVQAWGVDAVIIQGGEAGGHVGTVPTSVLLPQVVDAVDIPIVAAGGYFDGRGLVAALAYGASGIAMGTRFLLTTDSPVPQATKDIYLGKQVTDTVVTTRIDGHPHRVIRSPFIDEVIETGPVKSLTRAVTNAFAFKKLSGASWKDMISEALAMKKNQDLDWTQVVLAANTPMLLKSAMVDGHPEVGVMSGGQVVGVIDELPSCKELVDRIMRQAEEILERMAA